MTCNDALRLDYHPYDDLTVLVVPFPGERGISNRGEDKAHKWRFVVSRRREALDGDRCYMMSLNADELADKKLVNYVTTHDNRRGYIVDQGFVCDSIARFLQRIASGLSRLCGSCFIGYSRKDEFPVSPDDLDSVFSHFGTHWIS